MSNREVEEAKSLIRLRLIEQSLAEMLHKIDKEINQTDVEFMHLKSLAGQTSNANLADNGKLSDSTQNCLAIVESHKPEQVVKHDIDDKAVNFMELDLNLSQSLDDEDEDD